MVGRKNRDYDDWRRDFFDDFFGDFDEEMKRINERMFRVFDSMRKHGGEFQSEPFIYGFSYRIGPDGKPTFQEVGNVSPNRRGITEQEEHPIREPLADVTEDKENIYLTFELPGVNKENIDLKVDDDLVTISVDDPARKYYKEVPLQTEVVSDSASAKFVNGILDVTLKKKRNTTGQGKKVSIE